MPVSVLKSVGRTLLPGTMYAAAGRRWQQLKHFGFRRYCPLCSSRVRSFLPHGNPIREQALCPVCRCKEAHRLAFLYLSERTNVLKQPCVMLHIAPEPDLSAWLRRQPHLTYLSGDLSFGVGDICLDLCQLPVADNSIDIIFSAHVLNMIPDDFQAMREVCRVLQPGGVAIMNVPLQPGAPTQEREENISGLDPRLCNDPDIYRIYGEDFPQRFNDINLTIELEDYYGSLPSNACRRYGLQATPVVRCTKNLKSEI